MLLYWGWVIDRMHLAQRHVMAIAQNALLTLLLGLSALGAGAMLWQLMLLEREGIAVDLD